MTPTYSQRRLLITIQRPVVAHDLVKRCGKDARWLRGTLAELYRLGAIEYVGDTVETGCRRFVLTPLGRVWRECRRPNCDDFGGSF